MTLRTISYGGGVQSTALIVLAAQGRLDEILGGPVDAALFSNVGDDSEHPATVTFVREVAIPWAAERGVTIHELHRTKRDGTTETLWGRLMREDSRSLPIPVRMANTGAPGTRSCTADFKIRVVGKWIKEHGATADDPALVCIGISTDEFERASNKRSEPYERPVYPLLELGYSRQDCKNIIADAGLPVPPKSSCFFCPFHTRQMWEEQRRDEPDLFAKAVHLEQVLNERRDKLGCPKVGAVAAVPADRDEVLEDGEELILFEAPDGTEERILGPGQPVRCCGLDLITDADGRIPPHSKDRVYLTRYGRPLDEVISEAQTQLPGFESIGETGCDEGYCWT